MANKTLLQLKQKERKDRRRLILDAAQTLFARKNFREVTVREIARTADVSIGTIYNCYADMTELFLEIFLNHIQKITRILDQETRSHALSLDRLCKTYISYLNENMTFYQMMGHFMLGGSVSEDAAQKLNQTTKRLMDRIEGVLTSTQTRKIHNRLSAHALFSALNGIMISYARYPGKTPKEIKRHTLRLAGVVARVFGQ